MPKTKRTKVAEDESQKNSPSKKRKIDPVKVTTVSQKPAETEKATASASRARRGRTKKPVSTAPKTFKVKIGSKPAPQNKSEAKSKRTARDKDEAPIEGTSKGKIRSKRAPQNKSEAKSKQTTQVKDEAPVAGSSKSEMQGDKQKTKRVSPKKAVAKKNVVKRTKVALKNVPADTSAEPSVAEDKPKIASKPRGRPRKVQKSTQPVVLLSPITEAGPSSTQKKPGRPAKKSPVPKSKPKPARRGRKPAARSKVAVSDTPEEQTES